MFIKLFTRSIRAPAPNIAQLTYRKCSDKKPKKQIVGHQKIRSGKVGGGIEWQSFACAHSVAINGKEWH